MRQGAVKIRRNTQAGTEEMLEGLAKYLDLA
jgi:hypothetical protein